MSAAKKDKKSFRVYMQRSVNDRVRYYSLKIYQTLFEEYILEKKYGSLQNKSPTGIKREYYKTLEDAVVSVETKILKKINKGYHTKYSQKEISL